MNTLTDFHTHTSFCDGKNTPREMIETAVSLGFSAYGFSGHSVSPFVGTGAMSTENEQKYIAEVRTLQEEYRGRIDIRLGIEQELLSDHPTTQYEYVIGSVHVIDTPHGWRPIDLRPENITSLTNECFGGDFEALAEEYFHLVASIPTKMNASVIGHIDLLSKFRDIIPLTFGKRYYDAAFATVDGLVPYGIPFEINVGAITRGYRTTPYPDRKILTYIKERGGRIMINGDTHSAAALGKHLDLARKLAASCDFTESLIITKGGYEKLPL
ncbi:MAG: histidinol-phosphatase HisJ family protein [Clostridia bacterium]|nr:histidinol-phosphatase HisJ family protein [Clostridia bacterium]